MSIVSLFISACIVSTFAKVITHSRKNSYRKTENQISTAWLVALLGFHTN